MAEKNMFTTGIIIFCLSLLVIAGATIVSVPARGDDYNGSFFPPVQSQSPVIDTTATADSLQSGGTEIIMGGAMSPLTGLALLIINLL